MIMNIPDFIEPIIAYKLFKYENDIDKGISYLWPINQYVQQTWQSKGSEGYKVGTWYEFDCVHNVFNKEETYDQGITVSLWKSLMQTTCTENCPCLDCNCGFYSYKEPLDCYMDLTGLSWKYVGDNLPNKGIKWGKVELSGTVIEHTLGYRSQKFRLKEVYPGYLLSKEN